MSQNNMLAPHPDMLSVSIPGGFEYKVKDGVVADVPGGHLAHFESLGFTKATDGAKAPEVTKAPDAPKADQDPADEFTDLSLEAVKAWLLENGAEPESVAKLKSKAAARAAARDLKKSKDLDKALV